MAYTLRGRVESRVAAALAPLLVACALALALDAWWPVELAGLMLAVGLALDAAYYRLVPYQPGWAALPLGLLELGLVMGLARLLQVEAPLPGALGFFAGSWLLAQALGHAVFPLAGSRTGKTAASSDGSGQGRPRPPSSSLPRRAASPGRRNRRSSTCPQASIRARSSSTTPST